MLEMLEQKNLNYLDVLVPWNAINYSGGCGQESGRGQLKSGKSPPSQNPRSAPEHCHQALRHSYFWSLYGQLTWNPL